MFQIIIWSNESYSIDLVFLELSGPVLSGLTNFAWRRQIYMYVIAWFLSFWEMAYRIFSARLFPDAHIDDIASSGSSKMIEIKIWYLLLLPTTRVIFSSPLIVQKIVWKLYKELLVKNMDETVPNYNETQQSAIHWHISEDVLYIVDILTFNVHTSSKSNMNSWRWIFPESN